GGGVVERGFSEQPGGQDQLRLIGRCAGCVPVGLREGASDRGWQSTAGASRPRRRVFDGRCRRHAGRASMPLGGGHPWPPNGRRQRPSNTHPRYRVRESFDGTLCLAASTVATTFAAVSRAVRFVLRRLAGWRWGWRACLVGLGGAVLQRGLWCCFRGLRSLRRERRRLVG